jgi:hypothetical protein
MAELEKITSTGDFEKDAVAVREHVASTDEEREAAKSNADPLDEMRAYQQKVSDAALEPPSNALVEKPYNEGETISVKVIESEVVEAGEAAGDSGADEATVDRKAGKVTTAQAIRSPQPSVTQLTGREELTRPTVVREESAGQ